jgi:hypothetical protein
MTCPMPASERSLFDRTGHSEERRVGALRVNPVASSIDELERVRPTITCLALPDLPPTLPSSLAVMDEASSKSALIEHFGDGVRDSPELMAECKSGLILVLPGQPDCWSSSATPSPGTGLSILRMYNLPAEDLFFKWESFVLNQLKSNARELKKHIQRETAAAKGASTAGKGATGMIGTPAAKLGGFGGGAKRTGMEDDL